MGRWEDKTNAERGRRNAEQQGEVERRGVLPQATPVMMFRVPRSAFRVLAALWRLNLAEELQYRANFVASVLGTVFWIVTALLALAGYALHRLGRTPSLAQLAAFALALASAAVVVYALWVVLMSLAFWFVSVENLSVLFDAVYEGARYPVSAYPDALRFLFVYLIPIAWTTTIPASALTGRLGPEIGVVAALVAGVAFALARLVWRAALKRYTGASG